MPEQFDKARSLAHRVEQTVKGTQFETPFSDEELLLIADALRAYAPSAEPLRTAEQFRAAMQDAIDYHDNEASSAEATGHSSAMEHHNNEALLLGSLLEGTTRSSERFSGPRGSYEPLTVEQIEKVRAVCKRHFSDG